MGTVCLLYRQTAVLQRDSVVFNNMKTTINVNREQKVTEMEMTVVIPFCNKQKGSDFDLDRVRKRQQAYTWDLLGSFSDRLIKSLERRMKACQENLIRHLNDVEYSDDCGHIVYVRKDGTRGNFNVPSFNLMKDAITALRQSRWNDFMVNPFWVDQTLKAILNDTEQDHSDIKNFKYSELISLLCEIHMVGGNVRTKSSE